VPAAKRLHAMGVTLAMSDIGGLCVPLNSMRDLQMDTLLIGSHFVNNVRQTG